MDYEKAYKEALERAKKELVTCGSTDCDAYRQVIRLFPELKESEDEQHRKWILEYLYDGLRKSDEQFKDQFKSAITWLEKQGEQKNEIVPKFRVGDIIRFKGNETLKGEDKTHRIIDYDNELYVFDDGTTDLFSEQNLYELVEQKQDWSKGDKKMINLLIKIFEVNHLNEHFKVNPIGTTNMEAISTKEIVDWLKSLKNRVLPQPKQEWSEEDENMLNAIIHAYNVEISNASEPAKVGLNKRIAWLKSLKPSGTILCNTESINTSFTDGKAHNPSFIE